MALGFPPVVDIELNEVLATPDDYWQTFAQTCALAGDQALFLAEVDGRCVGMGQIRLQGTLARLGQLYVDGATRRHGLATALVEVQVRWAQTAGAIDLVCHIPDASAARPLAEVLGWRGSDEASYTKGGLKERKWTAGKRPAPDSPV
jgi:GNAT superfamily N-acetyltransferase